MKIDKNILLCKIYIKKKRKADFYIKSSIRQKRFITNYILT